MKRLFLLALIICRLSATAQDIRVFPTHWWAGMKWNQVQLMFHEKRADRELQVEKLTVQSSSNDVRVKKIHQTENKRYLFIDVEIAPNAKPQVVTFDIGGTSKNDRSKVRFEIKARRPGRGTSFAQGVRSEDFIYLLMPDRFANGDTRNDRLPGYKDQSLNRDSMYHRHGGDLQGVTNHLDYLQDLGVTALWMTPVLENDMPNRTEHGYAITDHYSVDRRHGGNEAYKSLSDALHRRGMKLIQDAVYNHCGLQHFFVQDLPMKDWLNQWDAFTQTTYKDQPLFDPYASRSDMKQMSDGWFTRQMPDLNQKNPFVANFLIQHALWSVEEFGVDGWRVDTYIYNDLPFMNRCNAALFKEYPKLTIFGETWVHGTAAQAYFTQNNIASLDFKSNLPGVTDFQTNLYGINPALTQNFGWTEGVNRLYQTLSQDFLYKDPTQHVNFLDNHDMSRFLSQVNEDVSKLKVGIGWLLTTRGIPQLYYGTEILLKGVSNPDGLVRGDFTGGWKEDAQNKFLSSGRTEAENDVHQWTKTVANFRKSSNALKKGKLKQFVPEDWVYTYFRYDGKETVMIVMNTAKEAKKVNTKKFAEMTAGFTSARNITDGRKIELGAEWEIPGSSIWILQLEK